MTCNPVKLLDPIIQSDEESNEYKVAVQHLNQCQRCRDFVDQTLSGDTDAVQYAVQLSSASNEDLTLHPFASSVTIDLQAPNENEAVEQSSKTTCAHATDEADVDLLDVSFLEPAKHPELLGRLGRYDIERVVGSGGMGIVFKAFDSELHRVVAIKALASHLSSSGAARKRFAREAQAAAAVLHPNVLPIYNVEDNRSIPYLVMQFISGESLQARVDREGPLELADSLRIARQTASALAAAHQQGLIHRDVKPANILLEESTDRTILGDFGLARTADDASLTRTGIVAGTPHYMSPEQAIGDSIDSRSDLFSLGCVMYFMLSGHPPFRAANAMAILRRICDNRPKPLWTLNPRVPREVSDLVDRLLNKKAVHRPNTANAVAGELDQLLTALESGQLKLGLGIQKRSFVQIASVIVFSLVVLLLSVFEWGLPKAPIDALQLRDSRASPLAAMQQTDWTPWDVDFRALESLAADAISSNGEGVITLQQVLHENQLWQQQFDALDRDLLEQEKSLNMVKPFSVWEK
jgi:eukaryotic-like serine/threonine-protein kinase